jgi:lipopolysaccharide heptosyltransferase II
LGDVVHALPVAGALRRRFADANISWLAGAASAGIVEMCRHVDRVVTWDPGSHPRLELLSELRSLRPQVALDLQGLNRTAWLAWLSGARWRVGFRSWQEGGVALCNLPVIRMRSDIHAVEAYLEFARYMGASAGAPDYGLELPQDARRFATTVVSRAGMVALLPGTRWPTKQWPAYHFAALAGRLGALGVECAVLGGDQDRKAGALIAAAAPASVHDFTSRSSLAQSAAVMAKCALAVCNDSGPMHLAAALGVPVVALFGPTDPARTGPYGPGHTVIQAPMSCLGCRRRRCGPGGRPARCMAAISPERVLQAVLQRLSA